MRVALAALFVHDPGDAGKLTVFTGLARSELAPLKAGAKFKVYRVHGEKK